MATLDAAIWLLIKDEADVSVIHDKYTSTYNLPEQMDFLWLYLYYAAQADHQELVKSIVDCTAEFVKDIHHSLTDHNLATCVNEAVRKRNHQMIRIFLDRHPDVCGACGSFYVVETGRRKFSFSPISLAITLDDEEALDVMMEYYQGQHLDGEEKNMPLHIACKTPSTKCFDYLMNSEKGVLGVNSMNAEAWTPLLFSALYHPDAVVKLVQAGADVAAFRKKRGNALQILSNWSVKESPLRLMNEDPCPTLGRIPTIMHSANDAIFLSENFVPLAKALVEAGIEVNTAYPPLRNMIENISKRFTHVRDDQTLYNIFKDAVRYLASVSNQEIRDGAMLDLCHLVKFVGSQLKRCQDYDNMVKYIGLMPFIRDLFIILLENGSNADAREASEIGDKITRAFYYLLAVPHPCAAPLRKMVTLQFTNDIKAQQTTVDIIIFTITMLFSVQLEEPELYNEAMGTVHDIMRLLCKSGGTCRQLPYLFTCLCLDPKITVPILHTYLEYLSQEQYHQVLTRLADYTTILPPEESSHFVNIKNELHSCQNRLYSLKSLSRRDIVGFLGGKQHANNIAALPLPSALKSYVMTFWDH